MKLRTMLPLFAVCVLAGLASNARADNYKIDTVHSSVIYRVKHLNIGYAYGRFDDVAGTIVIDEQNPAESVFDVQIKAESIDSANPKRDQHLRSPDFLNAKEFPTISFKSKSVKLVKERVYEATGDLTLHGITKSITIPLTRVGSGKDPFGGYRTGFEAHFSVHRSEFGMNGMAGAIGEDVWMLVAVEAVKQQ